MKKTASFLVLSLFLAAPAVRAQPADLTLNTAFSGLVRQIFEAVMTEACNRLGMTVTFQSPTAERALRQANDGRDDGDGPRIAGLSQKYPNLIQVPGKIVDVEFSGFAKDPEIPSGDWADLAPYRVGILIGWKILENNIVGTRALRRVDTIDQLFRMLEGGRIDVAVINRVDGEVYIRDRNLSGVQVLEPPYAKREMFLYLHKKHEARVSDVADVLEAMKADGTYRRIVQSIIVPE